MIRFVEEDDPAGRAAAPPWRAVIRHVQSRDEEHFTRKEELLAFINRYVDLESAEAAEEVPPSDVSQSGGSRR